MSECGCYPGGFTADTYEGPQEDCPVHGRQPGDPPNLPVRVATRGYDAHRFPGVPIPPDWVCAFVACGQRADQPHVDGCPYVRTTREASK